MSLNILSILLSLAMMLTGATGLETDMPMASALTIRDVTLDYNGEGFTLNPSLTAGVMTDNGTAVYDFSMDNGDKSYFPMQLVISEEAATLVLGKTGQAFTMDADNVNAIIIDALELDDLTMDDETRGAFEILGDLFSAEAELIAYLPESTPAQYDEPFADLEPVDVGEGRINYDENNYDVTQRHYIIDNDQLFAYIDEIYASDENLKSFYDSLLKSYNEALSMDVGDGTTYEPVSSFQEIYAAMGIEMAMDLVESTTADESFSCINGTLSITSEALLQPIDIDINVFELNNSISLSAELPLPTSGVVLRANAYAYDVEDSSYFTFDFEQMPEDAKNATEEEFNNSEFIFFISCSNMGNDENGTDYDFTLQIADYTTCMTLTLNGTVDDDGNATTAVNFDYFDDIDTIGFSFVLDLSTQLFDNAAEGLEALIVTPENIESLSRNFEAGLFSLVADLQTLAVEDSVTDAIEFFTGVNSMDASIAIIGSADGPTAVYTTDMNDNYDDEEPVNTELTFDKPEFTYLPEGMNIQDAQIDVAYNNASYTLTDEGNDNVIYAYIYGDLYASGTTNNYILDASGVLNVIDDRVISIEQDEDAFYVEMRDGDISVSLSCFGEDFTLETIGKILTGLTY